MATISIQTGPAERRYEPHEVYVQQHHWRNRRDEAEGAKLGMWLFLSTEILLFSGFFCAYGAFRMLYPDVWHHASAHYLSWEIGAVNTVVLLLSSWTVVMAIRGAQLNNKAQTLLFLGITNLCAITFLVVKLSLEYYPKWVKGKLPGGFFSYTPHAGETLGLQDHLFLSIYWISTATHGLHVLVGVFAITWCMWKTMKGHYGPRHYTSLENVGLYWHIVDVIWIFLFPLLYLV